MCRFATRRMVWWAAAILIVAAPFGGRLLAVGQPAVCRAFVWDEPNGMRDLGTVSGHENSTGRDINHDGQVVGLLASIVWDPHKLYPFVWDSNNGMRVPSTGGPPSHVTCINDNGQFAGNSLDLAVLWNSVNADPIYLGTLGGASVAEDINNLGQVVGDSYPLGHRHGFVWDSEKKMRDLGTLSGNANSVALGINNNGLIVGYSDDPTHPWHAVLWFDPNDISQIRDLGMLEGGSWAVAQRINDNGQIVGSTGFGLSGDSAGPAHACFWDPNGGVTDLGTLPGGTYSYGLDINNSGQVVGRSDVPGDTAHAFLWDSIGGMRDLGTLPGYPGSLASGINDLGEVTGHVWFMIPEPATVSLLLLGIPALIRRRPK